MCHLPPGVPARENWGGKIGGVLERALGPEVLTQPRSALSRLACSAKLSPSASLSPLLRPPSPSPFPSLSPPPPPAAAATARPRQFRPTGLPSPALSPRCPGPERSAAAQVGAPDAGVTPLRLVPAGLRAGEQVG